MELFKSVKVIHHINKMKNKNYVTFLGFRYKVGVDLASTVSSPLGSKAF